MGKSDSDAVKRNRNHNHNSSGSTFSDTEQEHANEEYVIERLRRSHRKQCSDWEENYDIIDLLS